VVQTLQSAFHEAFGPSKEWAYPSEIDQEVIEHMAEVDRRLRDLMSADM
jgi:hypothetical protein